MNDIIGKFFAAIDAQALTVVQSLYEALATALEPIFFLGLTVYIAMWGYQMMFGRAPLHAWTILWNVARAMLIYTLAFKWAEYSAIVSDVLTKAPDSFATAVCNAMGGTNCDSPEASVSNGLTTLWMAALDAAKKIMAGGGTFSSVGLAIVAGLLLVVTLVFLAIACSLVLLGKLALFVVLGLAPFFVAMALFNASSFLFNGWMREAIKHALVPVIVYGMFGFFIKLGQNVINNLALITDFTSAMTVVAPFVLLMFIGWFVLPQSIAIAASIVGGHALRDPLTSMVQGRMVSAGERGWNGFTGGLAAARNALALRLANARAAGMSQGTNTMFDGGSGGASAVGRQIQAALRNVRR